MSRSALAERFVQLLGEPPISYLSRWRLRLAAHKLASTRRTVEAIADRRRLRIGERFAHAFKTTFGKPPSIWRKRRLPAR
jgi:AraC-like DNA-binding protein